MRPTIWRAAAVSSLAISGGLVVAVGAQAPAEAAGIASARTAAVVTIVDGTVQSNGRAVAGAQVVLYEWPDSAVLSRLRPGQVVPWRVVASGVTDASGTYALGAAPSRLLALAAPDGMANREVMALSATAQAELSFPRQIVVARDGQAAIAPLDGQGRTTTIANLSLRPTPRGARVSTPNVNPEFCYAVFLKSLGTHWDVVGETHSVTTDVSHTFVYDYGASSSLGVGFSATDAVGSWSANGTASQSSSAQVQYPTYGNGQGVYYETEFVYGLFEYLYAGDGYPCYGYGAQVTGYGAARPPR